MITMIVKLAAAVTCMGLACPGIANAQPLPGLPDIPDNFGDLEVAWSFKTDPLGARKEYQFEATPLLVKGRLFLTAGSRRQTPTFIRSTRSSQRSRPAAGSTTTPPVSSLARRWPQPAGSTSSNSRRPWAKRSRDRPVGEHGGGCRYSNVNDIRTCPACGFPWLSHVSLEPVVSRRASLPRSRDRLGREILVVDCSMQSGSAG